MKNAVAVNLHVQQIDIEEISPSATNPRKSIDQGQLVELAASIKSVGVKVPLSLRAIGAGYEIVGGERRWRAAQIVGLETVPAIVRTMSDDECRESQLIENLQREDLSPLEEAEAYQQMFAVAGDAGKPMTPADLAAKVGKVESYVRLRLRLLSAEAPVREALRSNAITIGHALELARLEPSAQAALLDWLKFEERWGANTNVLREDVPSLSQLRRHIAAEILLDLAKAPFDTKSSTLVPSAGSCVDCSKRTGNSRMLFADISKGDTCTDPVCHRAKVDAGIDVTIAQLEKKGKKPIRITYEYSRQKDTPKEVLTRSEIEEIHDKGACDSTVSAVWIDGDKVGRTVQVCLDKKCAKHHYIYNSGGPGRSAAEARAKQRKEVAVRARIFAAIHAVIGDFEPDEKDTIALIEYAIRRADHNGLLKLAVVAGWPKEIFDHSRKALRAKLEEIGPDAALFIGLLASVSGELTVGSYGSGKPDRLEALAASFEVDHAAIRNEVEAEFAAKASKKPLPKKSEPKPEVKPKKPRLSPEAKKRIADMMRKRWTALKKSSPAAKAPAKPKAKPAPKKKGGKR